MRIELFLLTACDGDIGGFFGGDGGRRHGYNKIGDDIREGCGVEWGERGGNPEAITLIKLVESRKKDGKYLNRHLKKSETR